MGTLCIGEVRKPRGKCAFILPAMWVIKYMHCVLMMGWGDPEEIRRNTPVHATRHEYR